MLELHRWWRDRSGEDFWLEVTDREDIGVNLKAPQRNESGAGFWSYALVRDVGLGHTVFHYDRSVQAIVGASQATGDVWEDRILWAARGTYAREAGISPHLREGWYAGLRASITLEFPVTLEQIRERTSEIRLGIDSLQNEVGSPLYFPFESGENRPIRPLQGYLFKLPRFFVQLFEEQLITDFQMEAAVQTLLIRENIGSGYRRADEEASVGAYDPMDVDPAVVERGTRGHAITQNGLAEHLESRGISPRSPAPAEPDYDLAWEVGNIVYVAEVKSVTNRNEERQLRLGLG